MSGAVGAGVGSGGGSTKDTGGGGRREAPVGEEAEQLPLRKVGATLPGSGAVALNDVIKGGLGVFTWKAQNFQCCVLIGSLSLGARRHQAVAQDNLPASITHGAAPVTEQTS